MPARNHIANSAYRSFAAVAEAAGIGLYGGCLLESSIGAAAAQCSLPATDTVASKLRDLTASARIC